jgi:hypothetical protein
MKAECATGAHTKPSEHVPGHVGDLLRVTGHLRAAVVKRRARPPAAPVFVTPGGGVPYMHYLD